MPNVAEVIRDHVTLTIDCADRLYLNAYVPRLQAEGGAVESPDVWAFGKAATNEAWPPVVSIGSVKDPIRRTRRWPTT